MSRLVICVVVWPLAFCFSPVAGLVQSACAAEPGVLHVHSDFPGGSAHVQDIDQQRRLIRIAPTEYPNRGWACWWYFKVTEINHGDTLTLDVGEGVWATPDRAAYSLDNRRWKHTEPGKRSKGRIVYRVRIEAEEAWFAWGPPFVPSDAQRLVDDVARRHPFATSFELCRTREGRPTPALRIAESEQSSGDRLGIWIQARQHAWESGSSWVCRGFVEWLVSDDPRAQSLRRKADVTIVPIMDIDNVARGAGGKDQVPQDHNRDWSDEPHWRAVAAAQHEIRKQDAAGRFDVFVDLHNPGAGARNPYFYVAPAEVLSPVATRNLKRFLDAAKTEMTGPLAFLGRTIESGESYHPKWKAISKNWVMHACRDHVVAVTLETAWNTPHSTQDGYQQVGRELGLAIERYLKHDNRTRED